MKNFILILCLATFSQWVYAQNKQISGRVVDTKGEAAIGASILEKGTTNGTITDFDGNFKLTVGPKAVLQISYIGYKTQEDEAYGEPEYLSEDDFDDKDSK